MSTHILYSTLHVHCTLICTCNVIDNNLQSVASNIADAQNSTYEINHGSQNVFWVLTWVGG